MMVETIGILSIIFFSISIFALYQHYRDRRKNQIAEKQDEINTFIEASQKEGRLSLLNQGYIEKENILNLVSDDGGSNWYVIKHGIKESPILGTLEEVHKEVFLRPEAWEKLKEYVCKNGTIDLQDKQGVKLLERAGFEVRTRAVKFN